MRRSFRVVSTLCAVSTSLAVSVSAAQAATYVFGLTGGNSYVDGPDGNSRTFSATSGGSTLNMRVTGWSLSSPSSSGVVQDSYLGFFTTGLGVTSGDENGSNRTHTADNQYRKDFFILQFDQPVALVSGKFTAYALGNGPDTDATISFGTTNMAWNSQPSLNNTSFSTLSGVFNGGYSTLPGNSATNTRMLNPAGNIGNIWLVGAAFQNDDRITDAFKFSNVTVTGGSAVPEPATWAMMIMGFGLIGAGMRRRQAKPAVSFG